MSAHRGFKVLVLVGVVVALAAIQLFLKEPESTLLWQAVFNSGHAPLYGVASLAVLAILDTLQPTWQRGRRYLQAFWITFILGATMEALQRFGPRDPQIGDVVRNGAGIVACLAIAASFDRGLLTETTRHRGWKRTALWLGALGAACVALIPLILAGGALVARDWAFPSLCGFDTVWERQLVHVNENAEVEFPRPPAAWRRGRDDSVARVTFRPGRYSVLTLRDPYPDWTGYHSLAFTVYSELKEAVTMTLWVADDDHVANNSGSFRRKLQVLPGENRFDVPLADVRKTDRGRDLDMTRINKVALYTSRVHDPFSLFLDGFRLE